jgi:hypothetical protein
MVQAHRRTDKAQVRSFSAGLRLPSLGYYLRHPETGGLHLIEALEMWGDFEITQTEIPLTVTNLGGRTYGEAEVMADGRQTVYVGTTDEAAQTTRISWQVTGGSPLPEHAAPSGPARFPGLRALSRQEPLDIAR